MCHSVIAKEVKGMTEGSGYAVGSRVQHIPSGRVGVVARVYDDGLLVEVGRGDYRRWPLAEWKKEERQ